MAAEPAGEALLQLEDVTPATARSRCCAASRSRCGAGEIVVDHRRQRRRQVHAAPHRVRHGQADARAASGSAARRSAGADPVAVLRRGCSYVPAGPLQLPGDERGGEPRDGRVHPRRDAPGARATSRRCWTRFPMLGGKRRGAGGHALGRPAADSRDGDRAAAASPTAAHRRALARPRPPHGRDRVLDHRRDQPGGHRGAHGRAERQAGARHLPSRLRARAGTEPLRGHRAGAARRTPTCAPTTWAASPPGIGVRILPIALSCCRYWRGEDE